MHEVWWASSKQTCFWSVFPDIHCPRVRMMSVASSKVESPCRQEEGTKDEAV